MRVRARCVFLGARHYDFIAEDGRHMQGAKGTFYDAGDDEGETLRVGVPPENGAGPLQRGKEYDLLLDLAYSAGFGYRVKIVGYAPVPGGGSQAAAPVGGMAKASA